MPSCDLIPSYMEDEEAQPAPDHRLFLASRETSAVNGTWADESGVGDEDLDDQFAADEEAANFMQSMDDGDSRAEAEVFCDEAPPAPNRRLFLASRESSAVYRTWAEARGVGGDELDDQFAAVQEAANAEVLSASREAQSSDPPPGPEPELSSDVGVLRSVQQALALEEDEAPLRHAPSRASRERVFQARVERLVCAAGGVPLGGRWDDLVSSESD